MKSPSLEYPPMPTGVDESIIQPSATFKQEVIKVAFAILFFLLVYILLLAAASLLALTCSAIGFFLVVKIPRFITLMLGLGLVGLGLMVIFFLLKFLFKWNKVDRSGMIEVKEKDQPKLFDFVRKITKETKTPFPKKIYLSPEVNASVFYNSGFWSMFLPVRKNLMIGLGLVNSLNISEFKAVLAHEFGHFSQRSMKLGSYVYNVNKVIYDMLYENEGYGNTINKWASASSYFAMFAQVTVGIVQGIQWILKKVYAVVNKSYMSLSRQMEFHADAVAAYVSGSAHLASALRRIEASNICYQKLFDIYNHYYADHLKPENLYPQHSLVMKQFSQQFDIPLEDGLLKVDASSLQFLSNSRLKIEDQWASHPSTDDREKHLNSLNAVAPTLHTAAWEVFENKDSLQQMMTNKIYQEVKFKDNPVLFDNQLFDQKLSQIMEVAKFDKAYKGFYDDRDITKLNLQALSMLVNHQDAAATFEELFKDSNCQLPNRINGIQRDIETLKLLQEGKTGIKSFDFDGQKYKVDAAGELLKNLQQELEKLEKELQQLDGKVFRFFYAQAQRSDKEGALMTIYEQYFSSLEKSEKDTKDYQQIMEEIKPIFMSDVSITQAENVCNKVKLSETVIRERLRNMLSDEAAQPFLTEAQKATISNYLIDTRKYFDGSKFDEAALDLFMESMVIFSEVSPKKTLKDKKHLLDFQLSLIPQG